MIINLIFCDIFATPRCSAYSPPRMVKDVFHCAFSKSICLYTSYSYFLTSWVKSFRSWVNIFFMIMTSKIGSLLFMQFEHFSYPRDCLFKSFSFCLLSFFLIQLNIQVVGVKIHINIVWRMSYFGSMIDIENIQRKPGLSLEKAPRLLTRKPHKQTLT